MKMTAMAYIYPIIMKAVVAAQLKKHYSSAETAEIIMHTNAEYKQVVKRAPEVGGHKNIFKSRYLMGAYLIALFKNTCNKLTIEQFDKIISDGLNDFSYMKKNMQKQDLLSEKYKEKISKTGMWCDKNKDKYPANWLVSVKEKDNPNLTHIVFTRCGLCAMCKNEGIPEFVPSLCATDYITMSFANCHLERPTTLGRGDACCDFYITRK